MPGSLKQRSALWFGRFQPPSVAHTAALHAILGEWERLCIGIVTENIGQTCEIEDRWAQYHERMSLISYGKGRNPFTPCEVKAMWLESIKAQDLTDRVSCVIVPRPECWRELNVIYSPAAYDVVMVANGSNDTYIDDFRKRHGAEMYGRPLSWTQPLFILHNSNIRSHILRGDTTWDRFLPKGTYEKFIELDGAARIERIELEALHQTSKM